MAWSGSFEELAAYLRGFVNIDGDPVPHDFGGVVLLWLALLDNLRANGLNGELDDVAGYMSPEQISFLVRLADRVRRPQGA
jgi:hypothetical protein